MDMISNLPDSLLCHILSFLPTRDSTATAVLSRRWRHLWKDLHVLDITDVSFATFELSPFQAEERFVAFVNTVLSQRHNHRIQKFSLSCDILEQEDAVTAWILAVSGPYLKEFHLSLPYIGGTDGLFKLPDSFFINCSSLVSLTLKGCVDLRSLPSVHLPWLKYLELRTGCVYPHELFPWSPVLETLKITLYNSDIREISMPPSLKSLSFEDRLVRKEIDQLWIINPSLEYLHILLPNCKLRNLISEFFPNMVEAELDILDDEKLRWVPDLLRALSRTKKLVLYDHTIKCLYRAPTEGFPEFCCLVDLKLYMQCFNARFLIDLLPNCHMLQVLRIDNAISKDQTLEHDEPSGWTPPTSSLNCVISHLKIFEFKGYQDSADEYAFIAYILQRGLVLKKITIRTSLSFDRKKKYDIVKKLSSIKRGATTCRPNSG